ncbi:hypothetical protein B0A54_08057 [Friedmanniomyces endolithicus]|uniref:Nucleoside phosphorylase domain-containing protein n=1 Tax=Friedmanniomyces endolithicus TaxID=329885 RepID=A0A4U0UXJ6_9PEZI|nr:hypothetical protein B0A54_08057 [Friedmanniomyces endolithicus]
MHQAQRINKSRIPPTLRSYFELNHASNFILLRSFITYVAATRIFPALRIDLRPGARNIGFSLAVLMANAAAQPMPASRDGFRIAVICALPEERDTVEALMTSYYQNEGRRYGKARGDDNAYTTGVLGGKPIVLVAPRDMGTTNTRDLARGLSISFTNISYALVVGVAGGAPFVLDGMDWKYSDIHLGDVIISTHVLEYDFGRQYEGYFRRRAEVEHALPRATAEVANFVRKFIGGRSQDFRRILVKTNFDLGSHGRLNHSEYHQHPGPNKDRVYGQGYRHKHQDRPDRDACATCEACTAWYDKACARSSIATCEELGCQPIRINAVRPTMIHFGTYASGNAVMRSGHCRDLMVRDDGVIGFEMEGAGAWEVFGTIVIKGVVDYADSHKNKLWQGYAAARAALCATALIEEIELADSPYAEKKSSQINTESNSKTAAPITTPAIPPAPIDPEGFDDGGGGDVPEEAGAEGKLVVELSGICVRDELVEGKGLSVADGVLVENVLPGEGAVVPV